MRRRPHRGDARRGRLRFYRLGAFALGLLAWGALPGAAGADNCSGLSDCYPTVAAGLAATVGIALVLAVVVSLPSILASLEALAAGTHGGEATDEASREAALHAAAAPGAGPPVGPVAADPLSPQPASSGGSLAPGHAPSSPAPAATSYAYQQSDAPGAAPPGPPPAYERPATLQPGQAPAEPVGRVAPASPNVAQASGSLGPPPGHPPGTVPAGQGYQDLGNAAAGPPPTPSPDAAPQVAQAYGSLGSPPGQELGAAPAGYGYQDLSNAPAGQSPATSLDAAPPQPSSTGEIPGAVGTPGRSEPSWSEISSAFSGGDAGLDSLLSPSGQVAPPPSPQAGSLAPAGADLPPFNDIDLASPEGAPLRPGGATGPPLGEAAGSGTAANLAPGTPPASPAAPSPEQPGPAIAHGTLGRAGVAGDPASVELPGTEPAQAGPASVYRALPGSVPSGAGGDLSPGGSGPAIAHGSLGAPSPEVGAAIVQRALVQLPGGDHVSHLELAAQHAAEAAATGNLAGQQGMAVAGQVLRGLGLDAGTPVDLGDRVAIPAASGGNALYVAKASGALILAPLDPQVPPVRATAESLAALGRGRARAAFGRYLRWAEGGARPDALAGDPELAAARDAGLVAIGHARRADVERALGSPDRSWGGGAAPSLFLAYRLAEWPGYLYVFEFDTRELLRSQGFVADPAAPPGAPLAPGMTRDAVWARLGPPRAIAGWWPFERWEYPGLGGRPANYEFAHGILLARP